MLINCCLVVCAASFLSPHLYWDQLQLPLTQMIRGRSRGVGGVGGGGGGMSEHTEGHPEGRIRVSVMLVSVSTTVESLIVQWEGGGGGL